MINDTDAFAIEFRYGHPGGWTDDLGIISDSNTLIAEEYTGYHVFIDRYTCICKKVCDDISEIYRWCDDNIPDDWIKISRPGIYPRIVLLSEEAMMTFSLRWINQ